MTTHIQKCHPQTWHILGAGSMGCLWAASLRQKGLPVCLIVKSQRLISGQRQQSLRLSINDDNLIFTTSITAANELDTAVSRLIVCTKAQDTLPALESVRSKLAPKCKILLLQNGMGSQQTIAETFPEQVIWAGSSTDGAYLNASFDVVHAGIGHTWIGPVNGSASSEFPELLQDFRLSVTACENIEPRLWQKLAVNSCINGLTALFDCLNGELLDGGERQHWLEQLIQETNLLLQTLEVDTSNLYEQVINVARATARNVSSTCQDARQKRPTELSFINGFLLRTAQSANLSLPAHQRLMQQLKAKGIH